MKLITDFLAKYELAIGVILVVALLSFTWYARGRWDEPERMREVADARAAGRAAATDECNKVTAISEAGDDAYDDAMEDGAADDASLRLSMCEIRLRRAAAKTVATCQTLGGSGGSAAADVQRTDRGGPEKLDGGDFGDIGRDGNKVRALVMKCVAWGEECQKQGMCQ